MQVAGAQPQLEIPIPEYDWRNGNPDEFHQTFVKTPHPVVLRGFLTVNEYKESYYDGPLTIAVGYTTVRSIIMRLSV